MSIKIQKGVSIVVIGLGLALLGMMITLEGEPGAIPLALILVGSVGYLTAWARKKPAGP